MKHKKWLCLGLSSVLALSMLFFAACGNNEDPANDLPPQDEQDTTQNTTEDTVQPYKLPDLDKNPWDTTTGKLCVVHDPSVFYDEASKTYYAFGTHFAVASSTDLVTWKQEVKDNEWQKLYGNEATSWRNVLSQASKHAGGTMPSTWAPDVNYHDGKYYMYVSVTERFGSSKSAISRVESDNVLGPYSNETLIVTSDGSGTSNAIDPELFTDKDGGLWMVYGSTFGGIFIVELENSGENWGLPKTQAEDGKPLGEKIWAGGNNVEGPFVFYNDTTDYYYLMTSYGALMYSYNMRIARSKNPNGPYEDVTGQKMLDVASDGSGGNKVAGVYKFDGMRKGFGALGHNSVVKDETGRYFVVCHVRQTEGTWVADEDGEAGISEGHNLYTYQLFFNEEGWPVMSPVAYVGEKAGKIPQADVAGDYKIVIHSVGTTAQPVNSVTYSLTSDGKVTKEGAEVGSWVLKQDYYIEITIDGQTYKGVIVPGWDTLGAYKGTVPVLAITAITPLTDKKQGGSLWGICAQEL